MSQKRVILGLSGGVDSSVSAYLLQKAGYAVEAVFMKNWEEDDTDTYCSAHQDREDAEKVCQQLNIPFHTVNFASEYWDRVFTYFLETYKMGWTPNPDIICNQEIKFKAFLDYAHHLKADFMATGHYAARLDTSHGPELHRARDENKDQTYFLYRISTEALAQSLFPLATLTKAEVRQLAAELGFQNARKKDSTGICFIGERKFKTFLQQYIPAQPGLIQTVEGRTLGKHEGLMYYTLGQRTGLSIGGQKNALQQPWYVVAKKMADKVLVVAQDAHHPWNLSRILRSSDAHWFCPPPPHFQAEARLRHRGPLVPCDVTTEGQQLQVTFHHPQLSVTPGQACVLYQGTHCLGGGTIALTDSVGGILK
jgi:tRNA-specific 2-thiouridylase